VTADITLTIAEAAAILDPPMTEDQLHCIVRALGWRPDDRRRNGRPGPPAYAYDATRIMRLHSALIPFITNSVQQCARDRMP
jgi:hypothetical protein